MKFYLLSLKHSRGNHLTWWRPNERGYCWSLDDAGLYPEEIAKQIERQSTHENARSVVAVPEDVARSCSYRIVEISCDNLVKLGASTAERHKANAL